MGHLVAETSGTTLLGEGGLARQNCGDLGILAGPTGRIASESRNDAAMIPISSPLSGVISTGTGSIGESWPPLREEDIQSTGNQATGMDERGGDVRVASGCNDGMASRGIFMIAILIGHTSLVTRGTTPAEGSRQNIEFGVVVDAAVGISSESCDDGALVLTPLPTTQAATAGEAEIRESTASDNGDEEVVASKEADMNDSRYAVAASNGHHDGKHH